MAISSGAAKTKKITSESFKREFIFPSTITDVLLKNIGKVEVEIWFDDDLQKDSFLVSSGKELPVFKVSGGNTTLRYRSDSTGIINLLMWG